MKPEMPIRTFIFKFILFSIECRKMVLHPFYNGWLCSHSSKISFFEMKSVILFIHNLLLKVTQFYNLKIGTVSSILYCTILYTALTFLIKIGRTFFDNRLHLHYKL